jgi:putative FmdB family regulatory protein
MPLLEYRCVDCSSVFERLVSRTEGADVSACPSCHAEQGGKRLLSVFAAVRGGDGASLEYTPPAPSMGGGCGAACGCGH